MGRLSWAVAYRPQSTPVAPANEKPRMLVSAPGVNTANRFEPVLAHAAVVEVRRIQRRTLTVNGLAVAGERVGRSDHDGVIIDVKGFKTILTEGAAVSYE